MQRITPVAIESFLQDVEFPAGREDLVQAAAAAAAPSEVITLLQRLPDRQFTNMEDLKEDIEDRQGEEI